MHFNSSQLHFVVQQPVECIFVLASTANNINETMNEFKIKTTEKPPMIHTHICTFNCNGHSFFMFKHKQIVNTNTCKFTFTIEIKLNMVRNGLYVYTPVWLAYLMHNSVTIHTTHAFFHSNLLQYTFFFGCTGMRCVGRMAAWICCYTLTLNAIIQCTMNANRCLYVINTYGFMGYACNELDSCLLTLYIKYCAYAS